MYLLGKAAGTSGFSKANTGSTTTKRTYHSSTSDSSNYDEQDNSFQLFTDLCSRVASIGSYNAKTKAITDVLETGSSGSKSVILIHNIS